MARAFGDFCLKDFGLISVPEMSYRRLTEKDEFIVLATDGVDDLTGIANQDFHFTWPFHIHLMFVVLLMADLGCSLKQRSSGHSGSHIKACLGRSSAG